jgi:serine/threonine protein kinase/Flp pilus assembly protein TadD
MPENLGQEEAVFHAALAIEAADQRSAYLDAACADKPELRRRVEALLRRCVESQGPLDRPVPRPAATIEEPAVSERPGAVIGPYKLLQQIGEGGMGTVFMAEQTQPVQRKVALKVIKPGMDSRQVIARFEAERQALAMMDHVNIARVFDGGTTGAVVSSQLSVVSKDQDRGSSLTTDNLQLTTAGRPYFVMELVHGVPITKYCDDNCLTPRERLELFVPVCQAIQHAHQKGIIHRDIKPSNVMITLYDGKPVPKVIDFGVAKATEQKLTERTLFTQYGTMVGTFEYMSPEQAEMSALGVDTRSDIYSLGVLLYELLTGSTPLTHKRVKEAAYGEILRLIKEEEPPRPSTRLSDSGEVLASISAQRHMEPAKLTKLVKGELDWIVMKTLEKDRNRRYETAKDFAADVQRYLNDEPVQACPPSMRYRLKKFIRRNKVALFTTALVAVALLIGTIVSTSQAIRARAAEVDARTQRDEAEANFQKARQAVDDYLISVSGSHLRDTPGADALRKKLLETALKYHRDFVRQHGNDPKLEADVAASHLRLAQIMFMTDGSADSWFPHVHDAVDIIEKLVAEQRDTPEVQQRLKGTYLSGWDPPARAATTVSEELQLRYLHKLNELQDKFSRDNPDDPVFQNDLAGNCWYLSSAYFFNTQKSLPFGDRAIAIWEKLARLHPNVSSYPMDLARVYDTRGGMFRRAGNAQEAEKAHAKALALRQQLSRQFPEAAFHRTWLAESTVNVAALLAARDPEQAEETLRQAVALLDRVLVESPAVERYQFSWVIAQMELGKLLKARAKSKDAQAAYRRAFTVLRGLISATSVPGGYHWVFQQATAELLQLCKDNGDQAEAAAVVGEAIGVHERAVLDNIGEEQIAVERFIALAQTLDSLGKTKEAEHAITRVIAKWPNNASLLGARGSIYQWSRPEQALADYSKAIELSPTNPSRAWWHCGRATAYAALKQDDKALAELTLATETWPKNWDTWVWRGNYHRDRAHWENAIADYSKALELNRGYWPALWGRGVSAARLSRWAEAAADYAKAVELNVSNAELHNDLAWLLATCPDEKVRNPARAVQEAKQAVALAASAGNVWTTLGVARYRAGDWKAANEALTKSVELRKGGDAFDWFFLAMTHWQLGHKEEARKWYGQAIVWMDKNQPKNEEFRRFRTEAAELLGIEKKKD